MGAKKKAGSGKSKANRAANKEAGKNNALQTGSVTSGKPRNAGTTSLRSNAPSGRPVSSKRSAAGTSQDATLVDFRRGEAVLRVGDQTRRFVAELDARQQIVMGDYLRARQGFSSDAEMADVLGVHRTWVAAWKGGQSPDQANTYLLALLATVVHVLVQFLDPSVVPDWLTTEQVELGGQTPMAALRAGRLADVLQAANATEHGSYA